MNYALIERRAAKKSLIVKEESGFCQYAAKEDAWAPLLVCFKAGFPPRCWNLRAFEVHR